MSQKTSLSASLGFLVICGSVWGLSEAALGLALETCAKIVSGSIMTGVALFFISAAWTRTKRAAGPAVVVGFALAFKLLDALLLGLPLKHGAVANPMYAFPSWPRPGGAKPPDGPSSAGRRPFSPSISSHS